MGDGSDRVDCGAGYYCPEGTPYRIPCPPGIYCAGATLTGTGDISTACTGGYVCYYGSATATPTDGTNGAACPDGHYCVAGTSYPTPCPIGTRRSSADGHTAAALESDCHTCTGTEQCNARGLTTA